MEFEIDFDKTHDEENVPYGVTRRVMAPWGTKVRAQVFFMQGNGSNIKREKYAVVMRPKGNPHVRCSVFRLNSSN
jgi:hypothetical protein